MHGLVLFMDSPPHWLDHLISTFSQQFPDSSFFSYDMNIRRSSP